MFFHCEKRPEEKGISSLELLRFLKKLDEKKIPMHSLLIARGDDPILNAYWAPFDRDTLHRQNSVTKSFVSLAIGLLWEEGKLSLNDPVIRYFPEAKEYEIPEEIKKQTVRDLLSMQTVYMPHGERHWVKYKDYDRIKAYFTDRVMKARGTLFSYDSRASHILGIIAERLAGKPFLEYLKEKFLLRIGFSQNATCIKDAMGYSWADSGLLCTAEDLFRVAKFIRDGGAFEGERLMNEEYLRLATSRITSNCVGGNDAANNAYGYGYQIWHERDGGFGFHGMGMQYMICIPKKDFILVCTADTMGDDASRAIFLSMYEDFVDEALGDHPLPENAKGYAALVSYAKNLKLTSLGGMKTTNTARIVNGKEILLSENPMQIKRMRLSFSEDAGELIYENAQGEKRLPFGLCKNVLSLFPEDGYENLQLGSSEPGYHHPCATSAAWQDERTLAIKSFMTGSHLGSVYMQISFAGDTASISMTKTANYFLNEYEGAATGKLINH